MALFAVPIQNQRDNKTTILIKDLKMSQGSGKIVMNTKFADQTDKHVLTGLLITDVSD